MDIIRNFCIIAHIDHGKSTLADRMLQLTGVVAGREMRAQYLDRMDIERERGITIKSQAVRLPWTGPDGRQYVLNLIDTPGHVDFSYEVSRSLAACEGAILLVDAAQGIEAQTLANLYLALDADLHLIPVLNKIDLPAAQPARYAEELANVIGCDPSEVMRVSAKTGEGVPDLLNAVVQQVPAPRGDPDAPSRALIFDSVYDTYRGVVTYVRVVDGRLTRREKSLMMSTGATHDTLEVGVISPSRLRRPAWVRARSATSSPVSRTSGRPASGTRSPAPRGPRPYRWPGTRTPGRWCSPACTRWTATTTPNCATPWTSSSSTTPLWSTSRRPASHWALASGADSWACYTWRSSGSGWSGSSACR
jgi:small GTP-binding protein